MSAIHQLGQNRGVEWALDEITATLIEPLGIHGTAKGKGADEFEHL